MDFLFEVGRKIDDPSNLVEIIDFYRPISNLYGNVNLNDRLNRSQDLFLRGEKGNEPIRILRKDILDNIGNRHLALNVYIFEKQFRLRINWILNTMNIDTLSELKCGHRDIKPMLIINSHYFHDLEQRKSDYEFISVRLGRYNDGRFVVFLHPSTQNNGDTDNRDINFLDINTHEGNMPVRIPSE